MNVLGPANVQSLECFAVNAQRYLSLHEATLERKPTLLNNVHRYFENDKYIIILKICYPIMVAR